MNGEVGRDMNEASRTRSIVDMVVSLYGQKSKTGASSFDSNNQDNNPRNINSVRNCYRDGDSDALNREPPCNEINNLSKSPYANNLPQGLGNLNMSNSFSLPESYQKHHAIASLQKDQQQMQLIQLQHEQHQLRLQEQQHDQQQRLLLEQQKQRQTELQHQPPKQQLQRHNREYIGGAAAAAYNALRHDYYTAKQDSQPENTKQSQPRAAPSVDVTVDRHQPKNPSGILQGLPAFIRTDPRE
jgi:hypothetical protein